MVTLPLVYDWVTTVYIAARHSLILSQTLCSQGLSTLSSAESDMDDDAVKAGDAKLIGGGRGFAAFSGGGVNAVAIMRWWSVMKW